MHSVSMIHAVIKIERFIYPFIQQKVPENLNLLQNKGKPPFLGFMQRGDLPFSFKKG